jgi:hypothetical protein
MSTRISRGLAAALLALVGACAGGEPGAKDPTVVKLPSPGTPSSFHTLVLTGRHAAQTAFVGPGGRIYVATRDEVFVYSAMDTSVGERFPHHGTLLTTPRASSPAAHRTRSSSRSTRG